ncbi:MAG: helix-turn-helix transcriptional regulator [Gammaproteobacteria bacterium]|jgi:DNA-binding XRE family transcriptional regulator|nr:helix-turn-helix transcriptional regulator [Gammaproteobacteria bacterium]MBT4863399.1 helix-turn-helix transcriptional regulator [Gammaproteobacteria bacterium]MBT6551385.1 helix-turn-helix transcriptional regulator [Gammaproteobacteria bacterium]MBT6701458.1 helix-turn-helix transcriptional regulator [Gammaproteobacteria bacterium]
MNTKIYADSNDIFVVSEGANTPVTTTEECKVYKFEKYLDLKPQSPPGYKSINDIISNLEKDKSTKQSLEKARSWLADFCGDELTLKALRLKNGWSQVKLAEILSTSQSHIARIEKGTENISIDTCRRLCAAFNIDMNNLNKLLENQEANLLKAQ